MPKGSIRDIINRGMVVRSVANPEGLPPLALPSGGEGLAVPSSPPPQATPVDQALRAPPRPPKKAKPNVMDEISRTLPAGLELHRAQRFQLGSKFQIIMVKIQVPPALEPKLKEWRSNLEDRFPLTSIFIRRVRVDQSLSSQLRSEFRNAECITDAARPKLADMITNLCGEPPPPAIHSRALKPARENLKDVPFIAIDRPDVLNREDLIYGERQQDGKLILQVAIIDVSDYIRPGSAHDRYALRVGNDYYGRTRVVSTIGTALSQDKGSFRLGEVRPAWVAELRISSDGAVDSDSFKLRRAWVKNHANVDPDKPFNMKAQPEIAPIISALAEITRVLERQRINRSHMIPIEGEGTASRIVAETMIAANELISEHIEHKLSIPAAYIVHQGPSDQDHEAWLAALHQLRIPATPDDLKNDWSKLGILRSLEDHSSPLARSLENSILDVSMERSVASSRNGSHKGLRLDGYTRLKPREALGILNQLALDAALTGSAPITSEEIEDRVKKLNDNRWHRDEKHYRLRFFEMLEDKLALVGSLFLGEVTKIDQHVVFFKDGSPLSVGPGVHEVPGFEIAAAWERHLRNSAEAAGEAPVPPPLPDGITARLDPLRYHIQVDDFSKWGILNVPAGLSLKPGDTVAAVLKGFNLSAMRFEFELTTL